MAASDITFPVICFYRHLLRIRCDWDTLVTTTTAGVKNGMFDNMLVVDSNGKAIHVKSARKLHGVGLFWGFNPMVGQRIKVDLIFDGEPFLMTVVDVRNLVLDLFKKSSGWQTRDDFDELKSSVENASTIGELIRLLSE
ncbi:MAG: hypothetical protein WCI95_13335 [bacterium]